MHALPTHALPTPPVVPRVLQDGLQPNCDGQDCLMLKQAVVLGCQGWLHLLLHHLSGSLSLTCKLLKARQAFLVSFSTIGPERLLKNTGLPVKSLNPHRH